MAEAGKARKKSPLTLKSAEGLLECSVLRQGEAKWGGPWQGRLRGVGTPGTARWGPGSDDRQM